MQKNSSNILKNKNAQAFIEMIFMMPLLIVIIFFAYQVYVLANKAQTAQKYLKGSVVFNLMNRHHNDDAWPNGKQKGDRVAFKFGEAGDDTLFRLDSITKSLLFSFADSKQTKKIGPELDNMGGPIMLGVCLGSNLNSASNIIHKHVFTEALCSKP